MNFKYHESLNAKSSFSFKVLENEVVLSMYKSTDLLTLALWVNRRKQGWQKNCSEYDDASSQPDMLMETSVPIMDYDTCAQWFHIEQSERPKRQAIQYVRDSYYDEQNRQSYQIDHFTRTDIICAGAAYGQRDACQGKSFRSIRGGWFYSKDMWEKVVKN